MSGSWVDSLPAYTDEELAERRAEGIARRRARVVRWQTAGARFMDAQHGWRATARTCLGAVGFIGLWWLSVAFMAAIR